MPKDKAISYFVNFFTNEIPEANSKNLPDGIDLSKVKILRQEYYSRESIFSRLRRGMPLINDNDYVLLIKYSVFSPKIGNTEFEMHFVEVGTNREHRIGWGGASELMSLINQSLGLPGIPSGKAPAER